MTQVDFYVLPSTELRARLQFACKLSEKAWRMGHQIYLYCQDAPQLNELNALLWDFKAEAFLPHGNEPDNPILLGLEAPPEHQSDLLINLSNNVPTFCARFARLAEIVVQEPNSRQAARENFRFYREQGYALQNHNLSRF